MSDRSQFDPSQDPTRYVYEQLADHLENLIGTGELRPNSPLPAERRLAAQYGVALGTARHATRVLRERGLVFTVPAKGTFVAPKAASRRVSDHLSHPSRPPFAQVESPSTRHTDETGVTGS